MATTTPNFGWAVPTSSDLVKNGATAIETLGDSIDASLVDLKGGTTGQVLAKQTNTDMDFTWSTPSAGSSNVAGKNGVLNSNFSIWQRGTSIACSSTAYGADRWQAYRTVAGATMSRQATNDTTNLPFIQYAARVQRDSGNTSTTAIFIGQSLETVNSIPLVGKSVTFSFYARAGANYSAASSALNVIVSSGTGTDQNVLTSYTGANNFISQTATLTTTWQRFTYTGTVPTTATEVGTYIYYTPVGTAGANDYFEITGVQLEIASSASAYSPNAATFQGELAACQRYYFKDDKTVVSIVNAAANINMTGRYYHPVRMRTTPTLTQSGAASFSQNTSATTFTVDANGSNESATLLYFLAGASSGVATYLYRPVEWSAEL